MTPPDAATSAVAKLARHSPLLTRLTGVLLVLLGVVHLIATPFYLSWSSRLLTGEHQALVVSAMRLNHILVGILLIPLGLSTYWTGGALGERWAFRQGIVNAVATLCLPVLLLVTVPVSILDAHLFRLAILVLVLACLTQLIALAGARLRRRP